MKKISNKISLIIIIIAVIGAGLTSFLVYYLSSNVIKNQIGIDHLDVARSISSSVDQFIDEQLRSVESVATRSLVKNFLSQANPDPVSLYGSLENNIVVYPAWQHIEILDLQGKILVSTNKERQGFKITSLMKDHNCQTLLDQALSGKIVYSDVHFADLDKKNPVMVFMVPVFDNNSKVVGVVEMTMDWLKAIKLFNDFSGERIIHLLNQDGLEIAESGQDNTNYVLTEDYSQLPFFSELQGSQDRSLIVDEAGDDDDQEAAEISKSALISVVQQKGNDNYLGNGWILFTEQSKDLAFASVRDLSLKLFVITLLLFGLFFFSIRMAINKLIINPLDQVADGVEKISHGDFSVKILHQSNDEIGSLVLGVNDMKDKLQGLYGQLNQKVKEKTELLNQKLLEIKDKNKSLEDNQRAVLNILEDINIEKKRTEALATDLEKFKMAVDNASDHIVITDVEGIILYANPAVTKITGFAVEDIIGKKAGNKELWGGQMDQAFYEKLWKTIKTDKQVFVGDVNNKRISGEQYVAAVSLSPVLNKDGQVVFFVGIERDVTKEKDIDKAKTEFVSLASHQLRTPLSAINWYAEMLLDGDAGAVNEEQKKYLDEIYHGNQRMVALINALLNVSRLDLGTFMIEPEMVNPISLAQEVIKDLTPKIKNKNQKIIENYDANLPLIKLDPKLIRIVFDNLLSNAVKYTPDKGTIKIDISKNTKDLIIKVADTGYGIPTADQPRIFQKLFRADNIRDKDTDGTGLGLYIVKAIITASQGTLGFVSKENKGTTFTVTLPLSGMTPKEGTKGLS